MVELNVELLAKQYIDAHTAEATAKRTKAAIKIKLSQIMDLEDNDDLSTCDMKILRQEEGGRTLLLSKVELQEKYGTVWIEENTKEGKPITKFYIRNKKPGE